MYKGLVKNLRTHYEKSRKLSHGNKTISQEILSECERKAYPKKADSGNCSEASLKESNIIISPTGAQLFGGRKKFYYKIECLLSTLQITNNSQADNDDHIEQVEDSHYNDLQLLDNDFLQNAFNKQTLLDQNETDLTNLNYKKT